MGPRVEYRINIPRPAPASFLSLDHHQSKCLEVVLGVRNRVRRSVSHSLSRPQQMARTECMAISLTPSVSLTVVAIGSFGSNTLDRGEGVQLGSSVRFRG